jgi:hypothetical protein
LSLQTLGGEDFVVVIGHALTRGIVLEQIDAQNANRFLSRYFESVSVVVPMCHPVRHTRMSLKPHPPDAAIVARVLQSGSPAHVHAPTHVLQARGNARRHTAASDVPHLRLKEVERRED